MALCSRHRETTGKLSEETLNMEPLKNEHAEYILNNNTFTWIPLHITSKTCVQNISNIKYSFGLNKHLTTFQQVNEI